MGTKKVTIGYKYFMGLHMVLCRGPIDKIIIIEWDKRAAYSTEITSSQTIFIDKPDLFGGEKNEGGIQGNADIAFGDATQSINSYLSGILGSFVSSYRGVVSFIGKQLYISALNPYIKNPAFLVKRTSAVPAGETAWNLTKANIGTYDINPVHMIRELLTSNTYGLNYDSADIGVSFTTVADTLFTEGFGLSFKWTGVTKIWDVIRSILTHIDGVLYVDGATGKYEIFLIRDDYTLATLPVFDESNVLSMDEFEITAAGETVNKVVVNYTNLDNYGKQEPIAAHNLARINAEGAIIVEEKNYPMITDKTRAAKIAERDLRVLSTPLVRLRMKVNRDAWNLIQGQVFKLSWTRFNISEMVFRIASIKYGTQENNQITISALQDVFGVAQTTYLNPSASLWTAPNTEPAQLTYERKYTASYWEVAQTFDSTVLNGLVATDAYLTSLGAVAIQDMYEYEIWASPTGAVDSFDATGSGENTAAGTLTATLDKTTTTLSLANGTNINLFVVSNTAYGFINDEVMRIDAITASTATTIDLTVSRGCMDTIPAAHALGDVMLFSGVGGELSGFELQQERLATEGVYTALLPRTTLGILSPPETYDSLVTLTNRLWLPAPPAALRCGTQAATSYYGTTYTLSSTVEIIWSGRNRLLDIGALIPDVTTASTTEEANVNYRLQIRNQAAVLRVDQTIAAPTRTYLYDNTVNLDTTLEITLWAERTAPAPTVNSWKTIVHTMTSV